MDIREDLREALRKCEDFRSIQEDLDHRPKLCHRFQEPENSREILRFPSFVLPCLYVYDCLLDIFQGAEFEVIKLSLGQS